MSFPVLSLPAAEFPPLLREIPQPPTTITYRGVLPPPSLTLLTVVGSRQYTSYGKQVVDHLIDGLRGYPIGVVSGLALGIDALAHEAALRNNMYTLAVPGSGLGDSVLYPRTNRRLAMRVLESGGGLLSEFPEETAAATWTFPQRNRIMAGIAPATLVIEASEKSGTLITARMATDYNRELLVVPNSIFSRSAAGPHQFLKLGATPVTTAEDILHALHIEIGEVSKNEQKREHSDLSSDENRILEALVEPTDRDTLLRAASITPQLGNTLLMSLELKGYIINEHGRYRAVI